MKLLYEIKQWIITKIILFLMDGEIVSRVIKEGTKYKELVRKNAQNIRKNANHISAIRMDVDERIEKLENLYEMAIEFQPEYSGSGSWAVVVIDSNPEYIKFVRLGRRDMQDVARFLRQFDVSRRPPTIDGPLGLPKDFFYHELGRNPDGSK